VLTPYGPLLISGALGVSNGTLRGNFRHEKGATRTVSFGQIPAAANL
jgi:hypothetical protein